MGQNDTELITIATNRTSNASTVSVKAAAATAHSVYSRQTQLSEDKVDNTNLQKIDCKYHSVKFVFTLLIKNIS